MSTNIQLSHYYSWSDLNEEEMGNVFAEFQSFGCSSLVLTSAALDRIMADHSFLLKLMRIAAEHQIQFPDAHGIWGPALGIGAGCRYPSLIEPMIAAQRQAMRFCADMGCRTYTVHLGAYEHIYFGTPVQLSSECAMRALDKLLPEAEKCGLVVALENNCDNPGNADALLPIFQSFDSEYFGCCFDVGHAHYLEPEPVRPAMFYPCGQEQYFCADPLKKLQPYIVTAHLHDNDQTGDWHKLPGHGTIDWKTFMPGLLSSPRLMSIQSEAAVTDDPFTLKELVECFDSLMKIG